MRHTLAFVLGAMALAGTAMAYDDCSCTCSGGEVRQRVDGRPMSDMHVDGQVANTRDGYFFQNGKVMSFRNGNVSEVTTEMTLDNGNRILADGTIVMRDGTRTRMGANQWISIDGRMGENRDRMNSQNASRDRFNSPQNNNNNNQNNFQNNQNQNPNDRNLPGHVNPNDRNLPGHVNTNDARTNAAPETHANTQTGRVENSNNNPTPSSTAPEDRSKTQTGRVENTAPNTTTGNTGNSSAQTPNSGNANDRSQTGRTENK